MSDSDKIIALIGTSAALFILAFICAIQIDGLKKRVGYLEQSKDSYWRDTGISVSTNNESFWNGVSNAIESEFVKHKLSH